MRWDKKTEIFDLNRKHIKFCPINKLGGFVLAMSTNQGIAGIASSGWNLHPLQIRTPYLALTKYHPEWDSRGFGFISARQEEVQNSEIVEIRDVRVGNINRR